jgi:hypothetical protein
MSPPHPHNTSAGVLRQPFQVSQHQCRHFENEGIVVVIIITITIISSSKEWFRELFSKSAAAFVCHNDDC